VFSDTDTQKVFDVQGVIESSYEGGNCSLA
jgi:hypothetical protein